MLEAVPGTKQCEESFLLKETTGALMGLELTTDRYPPITSQTRYPLRHAASQLHLLNIVSLILPFRCWQNG